MTAKEFYLDTPLYLNITFDKIEDLDNIITFSKCEDFHGYNPVGKFETTYHLNSDFTNNVDSTNYKNCSQKNRHHIKLSLTCLRSKNEFVFHMLWDGPNMTLIKIGQYPSLADFHISQIKQYDKILGKADLKEFTKAIGLAANGVGIGSFVYLRRIFENLIGESVDLMKKDGKLDEVAIGKMRMAEKIAYLKDYLPEFLVEHKELYSILSLGIHELTEQVCLEHFETVKVGIEFILDEKLEKHIKAKKIEEASRKIKTVAASMR